MIFGKEVLFMDRVEETKSTPFIRFINDEKALLIELLHTQNDNNLYDKCFLIIKTFGKIENDNLIFFDILSGSEFKKGFRSLKTIYVNSIAWLAPSQVNSKKK